jgi:L-ascorbate metabolism protein UlaG (beta-lactamase superfamily)
MKFTYYGHACFAVEIAGKKILFDPFITGNPLAKDIDVNSIEADYILISHGHGDHVGDLISIAKRTGATVVGAAEVMGWAHNNGCEKVHGMNYGTFQFDFGKVSFVPAWHSSGLPDGSYGGNPGGFVIQSAEGNFYFAGDTCLMMDMQLIPYYAKLDFAVLPIGGNYTMDVAQAVIAADFIKCDKIIGIHFDTFEVIRIDHEDAKQQFSAAGKQLTLPTMGEAINL